MVVVVAVAASRQADTDLEPVHTTGGHLPPGMKAFPLVGTVVGGQRMQPAEDRDLSEVGSGYRGLGSRLADRHSVDIVPECA